MTVKSAPKRTLERKKREAEALKANMKKRKIQSKFNAINHVSSKKDDKNQSE
jgi:hypothetical protein